MALASPALQPARAHAPARTAARQAPLRSSQAAGMPRYLQRQAGQGQPLPATVQRRMEDRFGEPGGTLAEARLHHNADAASSAREEQAQAYTVGTDIVLGAAAGGSAAAGVDPGLLAHELTHVLQQRRSDTPASQPSRDTAAPITAPELRADEQEAQANARKVAGPEALSATQPPTRPIQKEDDGTAERPLWQRITHGVGAVASGVADGVSSAAGAVVEGVSAAVSAGAELAGELAMAAVYRLAPGLVPIIRRGPTAFLRELMAQAFDGLVGTLNALDPSGALTALLGIFTELLGRAGGITAALLSGDCQPLLDAIGQLRGFVTEIAGQAWERLSDFLRPVGEFFTGLWSGYGAPAVAWLQRQAGAVWGRIQRFGTDLWNWTEPVRRLAADAWGWVSEQLFGPADAAAGSSSGGIVGWVSTQAGLAWDWIKEQTAPVWQPVAELVTQVGTMLPPPWLRHFGQRMQTLSTQLGQGATAMGAGEGLADNRDTLASVLPSVTQIIDSVRGVIVDAGDWISSRVTVLATSVTALLGGLRAGLLAPLAEALGWLQGAAQRLLRWAEGSVRGLFDAVLQGFDALTPFIQAAAGMARRLIGVVGDLMQLPQLILSSVWNAIPCCIRAPVQNFLVQQILGRIPVFGQFFTEPGLWPRVQAIALRVLRQVFVDGDLAAAAWTFFQAALNVLGLPVQLVAQVLAKAAAAIGDILTNPIGFLVNLLGAMRAGFGRFFANIGSHLLNGISGWLFRQAAQAGLTPPQDLSPGSIFAFVLQVLGVSVEHIFERLAEKLDPTTVRRLRQIYRLASGAWRFVAILIEQGPAGLWSEIQEQISNLWNTVVDGAVNWVTEAIIGRATRWLLGLLDVTGITPVINTLVAIYNAIESFAQYLRELLEIVSSVLDGVIDIAHGAIDGAANFLEAALGRAMPVVIGFLANQFGLGHLGTRLQELLVRVRASVDRAIDWLLDRAIAAGQAFIEMARRGVAAVRDATTAVVGWWRRRLGFTDDQGESHTLYFTGEGPAAQLTIASTPQSFPAFLTEKAAGASATKLDKIAQARALYARLLDAQRPAASGPAGAPAADTEAQVLSLTTRLADLARQIMGGGTSASSAPRYGALHMGMGSSVTVDNLTRVHPPGSEPSVSGGWWETLNRRRNGGSTYYIMGHLLNHHLGGTGSSWANLTPLTRSANTTMSASFEEKAKTRVHGTPSVAVKFEVRATFEPDARTSDQNRLRNTGHPDDAVKADIIAAESSVPTRLDGTATDIASGQAGPAVPDLHLPNQIDTNPDNYALSDAPKRVAYVSEMSPAELKRLPGITDDLIAARICRHPDKPIFRTREQFNAVAAPVSWDQVVTTGSFHLRLYRQAGLE